MNASCSRTSAVVCRSLTAHKLGGLLAFCDRGVTGSLWADVGDARIQRTRLAFTCFASGAAMRAAVAREKGARGHCAL